MGNVSDEPGIAPSPMLVNILACLRLPPRSRYEDDDLITFNVGRNMSKSTRGDHRSDANYDIRVSLSACTVERTDQSVSIWELY